MKARTAWHRRGFTLVEILAVVVILGIASAIVIPEISSRDDLKNSAAARIIVADLIYAQNLAVASQNVTYVKFDVANNKYSVLTAASNGGDTIASHPLTQSSYIQTFGASVKGLESVAITSAAFSGIDPTYANCYTIAFDEMGTPYAFSYTANAKNDMNSGSIVLTAGTNTTTITVSPYTGEIQVQ